MLQHTELALSFSSTTNRKAKEYKKAVKKIGKSLVE
jgi:hypothetical protein